MNLDSLRRKRVQRLGVKFASHSGQRRIFFIFDRATRKFSGDLGLWMQYLNYSRKQKALKKVSQILTGLLRMHPTKPELWNYAAGFALEEHADMIEARGYIQRGLRFCKSSKRLWLEYFRLELIYITKIVLRRMILGLGPEVEVSQHQMILDTNADLVVLPTVTVEDMSSDQRTQDESKEANVPNLNATPVLSGAVPLAIFDAAMIQFPNSDELAKLFFDTASSFGQLPCLRTVLTHITKHLIETFPWSVPAQICLIKAPTLGMTTSSPDFPEALRETLKSLKLYRTERRTDGKEQGFNEEIARHLSDIRDDKILDPALRRVISAQLKSLGNAPAD